MASQKSPALKAWETRRANMRSAAAIKANEARKRSEAAHKAWATRRSA